MPPITLAVIALIISFISLIATIILGAKNYRKSKRDAFIHRRDELSKSISELSNRNSDARQISARYELVVVKKGMLRLRGEQADENLALIPSLRKQREGVDEGIKMVDGQIERLHVLYSHITLETDADEVERLIALARVFSDILKKTNDGYSSVLHILETTNQMIETKIAETEQMLRQIDLDFERAIKKLTNSLPKFESDQPKARLFR